MYLLVEIAKREGNASIDNKLETEQTEYRRTSRIATTA